MKPAGPVKIAEARRRAARALARVEQDAAFSSAALEAELSREPKMDPRDVALATELVYGVLRTRGFLDEEIDKRSDRGKGFDDPMARAHLSIGLYSLFFLERVPAFAAVSEAVLGVREAIGERPAGFANHVLRSVSRELEGQGDTPPRPKPDLAEAIARGAPGWVRGALRRSLGRKAAHEFLAAGARPAPVGFAVRDPASRPSWIATFEEAARVRGEAIVFREGKLSPHAILSERSGDPRGYPGHEQDWIVQEEGAQVVALALGARPGERVLDACAGRGNKSWLLASIGAVVIAADKHPQKLERLATRVPIETAAIDWTVGTGGLAGGLDRVLVDAPCSGVGTIRRRPEIGMNKDASSVAALAHDQIAITKAAARLARDGGRLVYAVCSVLREECEDVLDALAQPSEGVRLVPAPFDAAGLPCGRDATSFRLLPHEHDTDGFFVASFVVRRVPPQDVG